MHHMDKSVSRISKALLDLARFGDDTLQVTRTGMAALSGTGNGLDAVQRCLLERVDGFRSLDQLLAMSSDLIGAHGALGKLLALGYVSSPAWQANEPAPAPVAAPAPIPAPIPAPAPAAAAKPAARQQAAPAKTAPNNAASLAAKLAAEELANAKQLLVFETSHLFGAGAKQFRPRIEACKSIEEIYDLIVKFQQHLAKTGRADPDVFLDRLTKGLASARAKPQGAARHH